MDPGTCRICTLGPVNPEDLGTLTKVGNIECHANCLYFSNDLTQDVEIDNPWLGFNEQDILRLIKKIYRNKCSYCGYGGANVACTRKGCKRKYHFPCGLQHRVTYQFHDHFHSFCHKHRAHLKKLNLPTSGTINERCVYCFEDITGKTEKFLYFRSQCCNATYMHTQCAKLGAMNAGAYTKCPGCNAYGTFIEQLLTIGVNVPQCDAAWEDNDQFQDLYEPKRSCIASNCICPALKKRKQGITKDSGRTRNDRDGCWKLMLCRLCGGNEVHKGCLDGLKRYQNRYTCRTCTDVEIDLEFKKRKKKRRGNSKKEANCMIIPRSNRVLRNRNY